MGNPQGTGGGGLSGLRAAVQIQLRGERGELGGAQGGAGRYLVTMDADLQNDPKDLPKFLEALRQNDCVCGTRVHAGPGGHVHPHRVFTDCELGANRLSGEQISDAGCTYRAFKRECIQDLKFFKGMHRFLPTLFKIEGFTVTELP